MGVAVRRLGSSARRQGRASMLLAAAQLEDGEQVVHVVQGILDGAQATVVLTDRRVVITDDREWKPRLEVLELSADLAVYGLQDGRNASLQFHGPGLALSVGRIADVVPAQELASALRARIAGQAGGAPPP